MSDEPDTIDFANLLTRLRHKLHTDLRLALKHLCRDVECLVLELGNTILSCVVDAGQELVVDEDVKLVSLPLAYAPELQTEL